MSETADLVLLPWLRRGGTTALTAPDTMGAEQPGVTTARAAIALNDAPPVGMNVRLMGPGHVTGLQSGQVIRMDPTPGSRAFEPNYCALVEFDEPSLPWLFTPAAPSAAQRLRPWLCLVVVRQQQGVRIDPPRRGTLPVLTIAGPANPNAELPDLTDSWAWAHAQLTGELPPRPAAGETDAAIAAITQQLAGRPDRTLSRLVCGRILAPDTDYLACVVPTFELGRLAGLGLEVTGDEEKRLLPAWTLDRDDDEDDDDEQLTSVELPVYHSWEFATGPNGDFQSLAMLLTARPLPTGIGQRPIDVSASGVGVQIEPGTAVPLGGALRPVTPVATDPATTPPSPWPSEVLHDQVRAALAGVLNTPDTMPADEQLLAPPRYGATQAGLAQLDSNRRDRWYEELNLEPPARATAQFGTRLVQEQQEALVAAAWEQAAEVDRVNAVLRHAQFGSAIGRSIHRRHIATMTPDVGLQAIAPARAHITRSAAANRPGSGLVALWQDTQVAPAAFGTAMRRIARPQGAIGRRVLVGTSTERPVANGGSVLLGLRPDRLLARLDSMIAVLSPIVGQPIDGIVTLERVALALRPPRTDITWAEASAAALTNAPPRPGFELTPLTPARPGPVITPVPVTPIGPVAPVRPTGPTRPTGPPRPRPDQPGLPFGRRARARPIDPDNPIDPFPDVEPDPDPEPDPIPRPRRDSAAARAFRVAAAAHLQRFDPRRPPVRRPRPSRPADLSVVFTEALQRIDPTETFAARIRVLVAREGTSVSSGGGDDVPDERALDAVGFTPRFPQPLAPALATLDQDLMLPGLDLIPPNTVVPLQTNSPFVDAVMVGFNGELGRELVWREFPAPLTATFADRFWDAGAVERPPDIPALAEWGDRPLGGALDGDERFVVLLRSELLRRYPDAVVYATKPGSEPSMPILSGAMDPDVRFFGFDIPADEISDWSIVIAEQPTAPRFGVEVDEVPPGVNHLTPTVADGDAALLAGRLRQHPVRVTIPATVLLRPATTPSEDG